MSDDSMTDATDTNDPTEQPSADDATDKLTASHPRLDSVRAQLHQLLGSQMPTLFPEGAARYRQSLADSADSLTHADLPKAGVEPAPEEGSADGVGESSSKTPYAAFRPLRGVFEDDWRAKVTPDRPWPVILIHGTGNSKSVWQDLGAELRSDGWAVFAPDYGFRATGPLSQSLDQLLAYIHTVMHATGGHSVILVGHSQGGLLSTLLSLRIPSKTKHVVCLAAPNHGTSLGGVVSGLIRIPWTRNLMSSFVQNYWGISGLEQLTGSKMVFDSTTSRDITAPGVTYTCIASKTDQLIYPPTSCFLDDGATGAIENIFVQERFPQSVVLHEHMASDVRVRSLVREALFKLVNVPFSATTFMLDDEVPDIDTLNKQQFES